MFQMFQPHVRYFRFSFAHWYRAYMQSRIRPKAEKALALGPQDIVGPLILEHLYLKIIILKYFIEFIYSNYLYLISSRL